MSRPIINVARRHGKNQIKQDKSLANQLFDKISKASNYINNISIFGREKADEIIRK